MVGLCLRHLGQRGLHGGVLLLEAVVADVDHMQQQVGLAFRPGALSSHRLVGQLADEADGIADREGRLPSTICARWYRAWRRLVLGEHIALAQRFMSVLLPTLV